jgi:hypothetical protein
MYPYIIAFGFPIHQRLVNDLRRLRPSVSDLERSSVSRREPPDTRGLGEPALIAAGPDWFGHRSAAAACSSCNESNDRKQSQSLFHVQNARDDCPKTGLLFFYQVVRQVLSASSEANQKELRALQLRLNDIVQALKMPGREMAKWFSAPADGKSSCGLNGAPCLLPQKQLGNIVLLVLHGQFGLGSRDLPDYGRAGPSSFGRPLPCHF